jgi:hypothetical protein
VNSFVLIALPFCCPAFVSPTYTISDLIRVNIRRPERNREVLVFEVKDIEGAKKATVFSGYYIFLPMDIRFTLDDFTSDHYTARVIADHQVLVTLPAWPYSLLYNRDDMKLKKNLVNSMDEARHDYEDNKKSRLLKHLVLEFPTGHILSSKEIFAKATEDEKLALEIVSIAEGHKLAPKLKNTSHYACWKVARVDLKASKRGKIEPKQQVSEAAALLSAMMGGTNLGDDDDDDDGLMDDESEEEEFPNS